VARWQKLGQVFQPEGQRPWMQSHAANPVALHLDGDLYRVYFTCRNAQGKSHIGFVEIDIERPREILRISEAPVLAPGPLGYFDDYGVYTGSLVRAGDRLRMYYIGWNPGMHPPMFYASIGLAESSDGGVTFQRASAAPVLARSEVDPWMVSAPCVLQDEGRWRMWYISGLGWEPEDVPQRSFYHIKCAESPDGVRWSPTGRVALGLQPGESNIARPCVRRETDLYRAWFSVVADRGYRLGYAESVDGYEWIRRDDRVDLEPSADGWDSEALAYPWVFRHRERRYMLYSGNGFGRTGFGLAEQVGGE
jgi:hypothetical protein